MKSPALYHLNLNVPWLEIHYWGVTSGSLTWWYPISNKQKLDVRLWSKTHHCQHIPARILRLNPGCSDLINVAGRLGRVISFTRRYLYSRALKDWRKIKMRYARGSNKDCVPRLMGWTRWATQAYVTKNVDLNKHFSCNVIPLAKIYPVYKIVSVLRWKILLMKMQIILGWQKNVSRLSVLELGRFSAATQQRGGWRMVFWQACDIRQDRMEISLWDVF